MVDWTFVFDCLKRVNFQGPVTVHCEFKCEPEEFLPNAQNEVAFFKKFI